MVKTIGDAVMATFVNPDDGVRSALDMAATLRRFNVDSGLPPLSLKIGLHVGPCIVVSSNGRPDYFGQTVNLAWADTAGYGHTAEVTLGRAPVA